MGDTINMNDISKFQGVIPAFYACYDKDGAVSPDGVRALARYLLGKGVKGLYVEIGRAHV